VKRLVSSCADCRTSAVSSEVAAALNRVSGMVTPMSPMTVSAGPMTGAAMAIAPSIRSPWEMA
jgi:hypothetical protein